MYTPTQDELDSSPKAFKVHHFYNILELYRGNYVVSVIFHKLN